MKLLTVIILLGLTACGGNGGVPTTVGGNNTGNGCTIEAVANLGVNITCDGETVFVPNGAKGEKGDTGDTGNNGVNGVNGQDGADALNVFNEAFLIYRAKRKSVFKLSVSCEYDVNNDGSYDWYSYDGVSVRSHVNHLGTGFLIGDYVMATNKHVASDKSCDLDNGWGYRIHSITYEAVGSSADNFLSGSYSATTLRADLGLLNHASYDLAKFSINFTGAEVFEIDTDTTPNLLTPTLSMSFPLGMDDLVTNIGSVSNDDTSTFNETYDFFTSNDTAGGSSGSPIIDITTGRVIGVLTAGFADDSLQQSIVIKAHRLNDF